MATIRDLKSRIESIKSTKQITNAMKMVAAAKMRRAQDAIINARPYADLTSKMIQLIKHKNIASVHPLIKQRDEGKKAVIIVTSDRGLCGSFNSNIIRKAKEYYDKNGKVDTICLGTKGNRFIKKLNIPVIESYLDLFNEMDFSISKKVAQQIIELYLDEGYSKIEVIYNEFKSAIQQNIVVKQLLPILPPEEDYSQTDFVYEPDEDTIIEELGNKYINVEIWRIMLESSAAEQGARMTAMDSATENAIEMIDKLSLKYNRMRQATITKEIIEISSGAEAMNN